MIEIKTNQLKTRKKQVIDGHEYTVRRMGNIEQLDLAQKISRLTVLSEVEEKKTLTKDQAKEVDDISRWMSEVFVSLFDDGGDQTKSKKLVSSLSDEEIEVILKVIFEDESTEESS